MYCAISGEVPQEPSVCRECGGVFEHRLVTKYVAENGKCPTSGEPISNDDLIRVKSSGTVHPRPASATSIPGLLQHFQNEWDATMLETYSLKQQLDSTRQELAHALYQIDAASRVIARLVRERDETRMALQQSGGSVSSQDSAGDSLPPEVLQRCTALQAELTRGRKTRPFTLPTKEQIESLKEESASPVHKASKPGIACVTIHPGNSDKVLTGGDDFTAVLFDRSSGQKRATLAGHSKKVTHVAFHPQHDVLLTASADSSARIWGQSSGSYSTVHAFEHESAVTGLSLHPIGDYAATAAGSDWAIFDIRSGVKLETVVNEESALCDLQFHPDGMLVGTSSEDGVVRLWDMNTRNVAATFPTDEGKISICFSENGYYLLGASATSLKLWDLRKQNRQPKSVELPKGFKAANLHVDYSGAYTAVCGAHVKIFETKTLEEVMTLKEAKKKVNDVCWFRDSSGLATVSQDKNLRFYKY